MNLTTTLLFYLLFGSGVAVAVHLGQREMTRGQRLFRTLTAVVFWPLYLPVILQRPANPAMPFTMSAGADRNSSATVAKEEDELSAAIFCVETELDVALTSLGGWSDAVLAREKCRFEELQRAWHAQAHKVRELDRILGQLSLTKTPISPRPAGSSDRIESSYRAREANLVRLRALRDRLHAELVNTLARVRELVTMIHLANYTGAPACRADELVRQIATSIEGWSEVSAWRDAEDLTAASSA